MISADYLLILKEKKQHFKNKQREEKNEKQSDIITCII